MAVDIKRPLQSVLSQLRSERQRIDEQIKVIEGILRNGSLDTRPARGGRPGRRGRRPMSAAARRAVSRRMKAYWAKRRAALAKKKPSAA